MSIVEPLIWRQAEQTMARFEPVLSFEIEVPMEELQPGDRFKCPGSSDVLTCKRVDGDLVVVEAPDSNITFMMGSARARIVASGAASVAGVVLRALAEFPPEIRVAIAVGLFDQPNEAGTIVADLLEQRSFTIADAASAVVELWDRRQDRT